MGPWFTIEGTDLSRDDGHAKQPSKQVLDPLQARDLVNLLPLKLPRRLASHRGRAIHRSRRPRDTWRNKRIWIPSIKGTWLWSLDIEWPQLDLNLRSLLRFGFQSGEDMKVRQQRYAGAGSCQRCAARTFSGQRICECCLPVQTFDIKGFTAELARCLPVALRDSSLCQYPATKSLCGCSGLFAEFYAAMQFSMPLCHGFARMCRTTLGHNEH